MKYLSFLLIPVLFLVLVMNSSCTKCVAPTITFDPAAASVEKNYGDNLSVNVLVSGGESNIATIIISKTYNGVTTPEFIKQTGVGSKTKTVVLADTVPKNVPFFTTITYSVRAIIDCRKSLETSVTFTVTIVPSATTLDGLIYKVESTQSPYIFSHFTSVPANPKSWDLLGRKGKNTTIMADEDVQDSSTGSSGATLFSTVVRWGSRNGSKFVKAPASFDYNAPTAKSIVDAYKAGIPSDLITYATNDIIIVNIKNQNKFAVIKIKTIFDDGPANDDYTFFSYWLAQL